jgi:hypothetical protein
MSSDSSTKDKPQKSDKQDSNRGWLIPIVVIIVLGLAAVLTIVIATSGGDDEADSTALDDLTPEELADSEEYGDVEISGTPLPPFEGTVNEGLTAPTFTTDSLDGDRVTVGPSENAKVIGFFVHSCPHCQREVSRLAGWLRTNELDDDLDLVTVSTLANPERGNWPPSAWFFTEGYPAPVLLDDAQGTIASGYGMTSFPYWVVVDEDMNVLTQTSGELTEEQFAELMAVALADPAS